MSPAIAINLLGLCAALLCVGCAAMAAWGLWNATTRPPIFRLGWWLNVWTWGALSLVWLVIARLTQHP